MTTGHEPWLEPDPQVGQDGHIKDHKNWRNWFKQFWEDVEAGNYPGLIGPEGPEGPVGPDGPPGEDGEDGKDGKTPEVLHQSWDQVLGAGMTSIVFPIDPQADLQNGFDPGNVSVHLNGVLLMQSVDYEVLVEPDQASVEEYNLIVTLYEPAEQDDVLHVSVLFAFAAVARAQTAIEYMRNFGGIEGAQRLDKFSAAAQHGVPRLFIVMND